MIFPPSPPTLGVEWEVALADPHSRDLVPRGHEVIEKATTHLEREFLANTVELVTSVCTTVPEAIEELREGIQEVKAIAADMGLKVWAAGSHPFSDFRKQPVSEKGHYNEIIDRTQYWGNQMLIWGIHVHVGISSKDRVWPIINAMLTYYPHLLALTASSPGWDGIDTGYASNRTMLYQQLPTAGLPYQFQSWDEWEAYMADQNKSGVINHTGSMHFDIRPTRYGTVEVRICDSTNLRELSAAVALTHCLIVDLEHKLDRGEELPTLQDWHVAENKWRAARYGMDAEIIISRDTDEAWVTDELRALVERLSPLARELGCYDELQGVLTICQTGASYQRQRAIYKETGSWLPVVDAVLAEM
ncbi:glutamate--cysteine ligase [Corynebacterium diphtheriae]